MTWRYQAAGKLYSNSERSKALMPASNSSADASSTATDAVDQNELEDEKDSVQHHIGQETRSESVRSTSSPLSVSIGATDGDDGDVKNKLASGLRTSGLHDGGNMIDLETLQSRVEAAKRRRGQAGEQLRRERERLRKLLDLTERRFAEMRTIVARYEEDNRRILRENEQLRSMLNAVLSVEEDDSFSEEMGSLVSRLGTIVSDEPASVSAPKPAAALETASIVHREADAASAAPAEVQAPAVEAAKVASVSIAKTEPVSEAAATADAATAAADEAIEVVDIADAKARITEALAAVDRGDESAQQSRRGGFGFFRRGGEEQASDDSAEKAEDSGSMANEFADVLAELERSESETQRDSDSFQYNLRPGPRSGS